MAEARMNWKRGTLRLWLAASLLWVAGMGWYQYQDAHQQREGITIEFGKDKPLHIDSTGIHQDADSKDTAQIKRILWIVLPPLLLLFAFPVADWLSRGFRTGNGKNS